MAKTEPHVHLTRRERQIMDVLYTRGEASAGDVHGGIPDAPSYSAVRALLKKLLDKGHVRFRADGPRYVYRPVMNKSTAKRRAMDRLVRTFFAGSTSSAVVGMLGTSEVSDDEIAHIEAALAELKAKRD